MQAIQRVGYAPYSRALERQIEQLRKQCRNEGFGCSPCPEHCPSLIDLVLPGIRLKERPDEHAAQTASD